MIKQDCFSQGYSHSQAQFLHLLDPCIQMTSRPCCSDFWKSHCSHALGLKQRSDNTPDFSQALHCLIGSTTLPQKKHRKSQGHKWQKGPAQPSGEGQCKWCCYILQLPQEPEHKHSSGIGVENCFQEAPG